MALKDFKIDEPATDAVPRGTDERIDADSILRDSIDAPSTPDLDELPPHLRDEDAPDLDDLEYVADGDKDSAIDDEIFLDDEEDGAFDEEEDDDVLVDDDEYE